MLTKRPLSASPELIRGAFYLSNLARLQGSRGRVWLEICPEPAKIKICILNKSPTQLGMQLGQTVRFHGNSDGSEQGLSLSRTHFRSPASLRQPPTPSFNGIEAPSSKPKQLRRPITKVVWGVLGSSGPEAFELGSGVASG